MSSTNVADPGASPALWRQPAPILNLNGSAGDELVRQKLEAIQALRDAIPQLLQARPHLRDYQGSRGEDQGSMLYKIAREIHEERARVLYQIRDELREEAREIMNQRRR